MMAGRAHAKPSDVTVEFWAAADRGVLLLQNDARTGRCQFFPRPVNLFGETKSQWKAASGLGTLIAVTTVRVPAPGFEAPYLVGLIKLAEGPRVFARLLNAGPHVALGQKVRLAWEPGGEGPRLYAFEPA
jgi:uncharacterized OB-fold protein